MSLPGNGSVLATHVARKALFEEAGRLWSTIRYYRDDDDLGAARNVASKAAFENAMALDVAMGGSTNTVLHALAAADEAELDFSLNDIDAISGRVGCICRRRPTATSTWRTCTGPAASRRSWGESTGPGSEP